MIFSSLQLSSQINSSQLGAWQMYFFKFSTDSSSFGFQGDIQLRNWDIGSDLEQTIIRGGLTYLVKKKTVLLTLGYGNIRYGEFGENKTIIQEHRIYQQADYITKPILGRFTLYQRLRSEQKFTDLHGLRLRFRLKVMFNMPIKKKLCLVAYNEIFMYGTNKSSLGVPINTFDRNRIYLGLGYKFNSKLKTQVGIMNQKTNNWHKNQLQLSLHHNI